MTDVVNLCGCGTPFNSAGTSCDVCQSPIGFPNVRAAQSDQQALVDRFDLEMASIKIRKIDDVASEFIEAVNKANVVIARSMLDLIPMIQNSNKLFATFHNQVASNARLAENNEFDPKRETIESLLHPFYYKNIHYAALSLDCVGIKDYGDVHIKFHNKFIQNRTSFFEENPFNFVKKHNLLVGDSVPPGFRSTWEEKGKLALCKYHANLYVGMESKQFKDVLVVNKDNPDFIEAHIYGNIHVACIDKITMFSDAEQTSTLLFNANKKKFKDLDIKIEMRSA